MGQSLSFWVNARSRVKNKPPPAKQPLQSTQYRALAAALQARTNELGLTVRALAKRLGRPHATVHKTLRCQRRLDPIEFADWCEALRIKHPMQLVARVKQRGVRSSTLR